MWNQQQLQMMLLDGVPFHGPLTRYEKLLVAHAPGIPGTFSPSPRVSDPEMHHGTCVTHVPWCMSVSLTSGFLWRRWRGKRSRHSWRMRNPQFCVSVRRHVPTFHIHISQNKLPKYLLWELPLSTILNVQANVSIPVCMLPAMYLNLNWYLTTQTIITSHAVHSTASWTRSEGIWMGPDFPFPDGW